ncbi:MAG: polymer-forming cytoskeletal protein [Nitrospira sp.]
MWDTKKPKNKQTDAENFTVLGKDVTFKGIVYFEGTVQLDGCVEGEIHTTGVLVVGEHAEIRGSVSVGTLLSSGKIHGTVAAVNKVQLLKTAVQIGDVHTPAFSIEDGAYFKGFADMGPGPKAEESSQHSKGMPTQAIRRDSASLRLTERESDYKQLAHNVETDELVH